MCVQVCPENWRLFLHYSRWISLFLFLSFFASIWLGIGAVFPLAARSWWMRCCYTAVNGLSGFFSYPNSTVLECGDWIWFDRQAASFQAPLWGIAGMFMRTPTRAHPWEVDELNHRYDRLTWQPGHNSRQQWFHWPGVPGSLLDSSFSSIHLCICALWYLSANCCQAVNRTCSFFNCSQMKQQIEVQLITSISAVQQLLYKLQTRLNVYSLLWKRGWCKSYEKAKVFFCGF